jgi:hypothetical protein
MVKNDLRHDTRIRGFASRPLPPRLLTFTQFGARVTFGDGFAVFRVQINDEQCSRVVLGNIPGSITRPGIWDAMIPFGHVLDIKFKDDPSKRTDAMFVHVAYASHSSAVEAVSALDGSCLFGREISAELPAGTSIGQGLIHDTTVELYWDAPIMVGYAGYATLRQAEKVIALVSGQEFGGRALRACIHSGLPSLGAYTVRVEGIPSRSKMYDRKLIGKTEGVMVQKPKYIPRAAVPSIRELVEETVGEHDLVDFAVELQPDREGHIRAVVTCSSTFAAQRLVSTMNGQTFKRLGDGHVTACHIHSISYRVPKTSYELLIDDISALESDLIAVQGRVVISQHDSDKPETTIDITAPSQEVFRAFKQRLEALLRGEIVSMAGVPAWDDFFLYNSCHRFLGYLRHQYPSVLLQRDRNRRLIKLFGPSADRQAMAELIIDKVRRLQRQQRHIFPLPGRLIGLFMTADLISLRDELGWENVYLDRTRRVLQVRGGEAARRLARETVDRAERRYPPRLRGGTASCPVCLDKTEDAIVLACGHRWCRACLHGYLTSDAVQHGPVTCLGAEAKCAHAVPLAVAQELLDKRAFDEATRRAFTAHVRARPHELQFCPTPDCPEVYRPGPPNATRQCPTCLNRICTFCRAECHDTVRCEDRERNQEPLFKEWAASHDVKPCPRCGSQIERVAGCNHMTCIVCKTHICWVCLKTFPDDVKIYDHMRETHGGIGL